MELRRSKYSVNKSKQIKYANVNKGETPFISMSSILAAVCIGKLLMLRGLRTV